MMMMLMMEKAKEERRIHSPGKTFKEEGFLERIKKDVFDLLV